MFICVLILLSLCSTLCSCQLTRAYDSCAVLDQGAEFIFHFTTVNGTLQGAIEAPSAGWIAIGFSKSSQNAMIDEGSGADILMGFVKPTGPCATGCLNSYAPIRYPDDTGNPAVSTPTGTLVSGSIDAGRMYIEFDRPLVSSRSTIDPAAAQTVIWAYNANSNSVADDTGDTYTKHPSNTRGVFNGLVLNAETSTCPLTGAPILGGNEYVSQDGKYVAKWTTSGDDIRFEVTVETVGWIGLGFSTNQLMTDSDVYVGWVDNDVVYVSDRNVAGNRIMPALDAQSDISDISGFKTSTHTTIRFTRPLVSTDTAGDVNLDNPKNILWAYGGSYDHAAKTFLEHTQRGVVLDVSFTDSCQAAPANLSIGADALVFFHVIGMVFAWAVLIPVGSFAARYLKATGTYWFPIHVVFQCLGMLLAVGGFATIFASRGSFVSGTHAIIGLVVFSLMLLQGILGASSHFCYKPDRDGPPAFPDQIHWWLGRLVMVVAVVAMALGVVRYNELYIIGSTLRPWVLFGVWAAAALGCFIWGEINARKNGTLPSSATHDSYAAHNSDELDIEDDKFKSGPKPVVIFAIMTVLSLCLIGAFLGLLLTSGASVTAGGAPRAPTEVLQTCFTMPKYALPSNKPTHYTCIGFKYPAGEPFHAYEFEPVIDNAAVVHHLFLYDTGDTLISSEPYECNMPQGSTILYAWALGGPTFTAPSDSGFKMPVNGAMQIHYDNPSQTAGIIDASGARMRYTNILRPKESAFFQTGVTIKSLKLPPGLTQVEVSSTCTLPTFPASIQPRLWSVALHMHKRGKQIVMEHWRKQSGGNYVRIDDIGCNPFYDFNKQEFVTITPNVILESQDRFVTRCIFETTNDVNVVKGGEESDDEMCFAFVTYDPDLDASLCQSAQVLSATIQSPLCFNGTN